MARVRLAARPSGAAGRHVALTLDDAVGEDPAGVAELLQVLRELDVQATFFAIMDNGTLEHGGVLREAAAAGHEIGNHGTAPTAMLGMTGAEVRAAMEAWERGSVRSCRVGPLRTATSSCSGPPKPCRGPRWPRCWRTWA
ncbi:unnamed protein product, partial [Prorocentrum cordatum]